MDVNIVWEIGVVDIRFVFNYCLRVFRVFINLYKIKLMKKDIVLRRIFVLFLVLSILFR